MKIPKKLEEKRDELAQDRCVMPWTTLESDEERKEYFNQGFNDCANLLLPEIEKLEEAIKQGSFYLVFHSQGKGATEFFQMNEDAGKILEALQSLREFLGEEREGEDE